MANSVGSHDNTINEGENVCRSVVWVLGYKRLDMYSCSFQETSPTDFLVPDVMEAEVHLAENCSTCVHLIVPLTDVSNCEVCTEGGVARAM